MPGSTEPVVLSIPEGPPHSELWSKTRDGTVLLREHGYVGHGSGMSNNVAEYAGVLHILKYLATRPPGESPSMEIPTWLSTQLNGKWRIRKGLYRSIAMEAKELLAHLKGLGWQITLCWIPRAQNEECDALSKKIRHPAPKPSPNNRKCRTRQDPRDALMLGTIKTTGITVLRAEPSRCKDWWVCYDARAVECSLPTDGM